MGGVGACGLHQALGLLGGLGAQRLDLLGGGGAQALDIDIGLGDQPGGLLLGDAKGALEACAETGVGRSAHLVELSLQVVGDGLQSLDVLAQVRLGLVRLDQVAPKLAESLVDFVLLVAPEFGAESRVVYRHCACSSIGVVPVRTLGRERESQGKGPQEGKIVPESRA